jgi:hypothetical protein
MSTAIAVPAHSAQKGQLGKPGLIDPSPSAGMVVGPGALQNERRTFSGTAFSASGHGTIGKRHFARNFYRRFLL